jgi:hypothetical protein
VTGGSHDALLDRLELSVSALAARAGESVAGRDQPPAASEGEHHADRDRRVVKSVPGYRAGRRARYLPALAPDKSHRVGPAWRLPDRCELTTRKAGPARHCGDGHLIADLHIER